MRITTKGQVTIPQELRERYAMGPGAEVEVVPTEDGALVRPVAHGGQGDRLLARLRDRADGGLTAEQVLHLTRGDS
ncbi:AbrB/MazE/SpoVT family DNA-binding domain-containing protein [soil metagenome]|jgi:AbrB family looped-hinge helix DNA binding protein